MADLRFDGKVAIITGAGNGLGRAHALLFGARGAKVVVNDLGGAATGGGKSSAAADKVVEEIVALGGQAVANYDSVEDGDKIVQTAMDTFGGVDILVNNAGILRDTSFQKMSDEDWDLIYRVHVLGAYKVTKAAWNHLRDKGYGRIVFTASAAGIYGNFGQANYAMAKLGLHGFAQTLAIEGKKKNVLVNTIAPIAGSRMTETILPPELVAALRPEYVSPLVAYLAHESTEETGGLYEVGGGFVGKLRWERAEGQTFKLGRDITPEQIRDKWSAISGFTTSTHPADVTASMQPVLGNATNKSLGGNDFIDVDQALGAALPETTSSYDARDLSLYALGVGAAQDPNDELERAFVYERHGKGFRPLPTFAVIPALNALLKSYEDGQQVKGLNYGFERVLHGEQYTELLRPLPEAAELRHTGKIKAIYDKGKGAVVITEIRTADAKTGEALAINEITTFVKGAGGWGGDRGPSADGVKIPERPADKTIEETISPSQALLYRLSGDWNPLHADPEFAKAFGFDKPILHGLCTFGYAGRHVVKAFAGGDTRLFKSIRVRFSETVFPGETLVTEMWQEAGKILFQCKVKERGKLVLSGGAIELHAEVPKPQAKPTPAAIEAKADAVAAPSGGAGEPIAADVFEGIRDYVAKNPDAAKIGVVYQFKLMNPASVWTLDLKGGAVAAGETTKPECTLEMENADFMDMCAGKADPQKLYFGGKMVIGGNLMASQKLTFLKKVDPQVVLASARKRGGGTGAAVAPAGAPAQGAAPNVAPAAATAAPKVAKAPAILDKLAARLAESPSLAKEAGALIELRVKGPDEVWALDFTGAGAIAKGAAKEPTTILTLSDDDLASLAKNETNVKDLYQHGKLRIDGDLRVAHRLGFLAGLGN